MRLRDWHRLYLTIIGILIFAYVIKPCKTDCPDIGQPATVIRHVEAIKHDDTWKTDAAKLQRSREIRIKRKYLQPGDTVRYALQDSAVLDTCTVYTASSGDSLVDIEVSVCSPCDLDSIGIAFRHKGIKQIVITDSVMVPVPVPVGSTKMLFAGMQVSSNGGFGPKVSYVNARNQFSYHFDAVNRHHHIGMSWPIWRR